MLVPFFLQQEVVPLSASPDSLALWQSFLALLITLLSADDRVSRFVIPILIVPLRLSASIFFTFSCWFRLARAYFGSSFSLRKYRLFWIPVPHCDFSAMSPQFSPPHCYQLSLAGGYLLLRIHLPPALLHLSLVFPLVRIYLFLG